VRASAPAVFPQAAELGLADRLAGVVLQCLRRGLAGVGVELLACQAERVVGALGLVADGELQAVLLALPAQAHAGQAAVRLALRPEAVDVHARQVDRQVDAVAQRCRQADAQLAQAEAARVQPDLDAGLAHRLREQRDDAARGIAIQRRERAAQHLDAVGAGEVEVADLALTVGHRRRDAVGVQAQAAHAEAARADLQVLGVVVAVGDDQARHARHRLRQVDHRAAVTQRRRLDASTPRRR
jgi:hypothetical protein